MLERMNQCVLKWFERMEKMENGRLVKKIYKALNGTKRRYKEGVNELVEQWRPELKSENVS